LRKATQLLSLPVFWAAVCAASVFGWQTLTVNANYAHDYSALFYTGSYITMPQAIAEEGTFRIPNDAGYDGQFYHFIAHDPFLRNDTARFVDNPRVRWRRILVPLTAWLLAFGQSDYIDSTYLITVLGFVFLGAFWLAEYCRRFNLTPACGVAFAIVPAVLVSIDRFTVDVALAALCIGFAVETRWRLFLILMLAPLSRETGIVLPATFALHSVFQKNWKGLGMAAGALVPFAAWLVYLDKRTAPDFSVLTSPVPFKGLVERTIHPVQHALTSSWLRKEAAMDYVAVIGIWGAVALVAYLLWQRRSDFCAIAAILFTSIFVAFVSQPQIWSGSYSFARTMSPLLIFLALIGIADRSWIYLVPMALALPRVLYEDIQQWRGIFHGLKSTVLSLF
jgi:hypothetical protein